MTTLTLRDPGFLTSSSRNSSVSLLLRGDYISDPFTILDSSQRQKTIAAVGNATVSTTVFKYGTSSLQFDGAADYLTSPTNTDFDFGSGDFTVECWVNLNSVATDQAFVFYGSSATGSSTSFGLDRLQSSNQFRAFYYVSNTLVIAVNAISINAGQWYHVAGVRTGGQLRCFVNGIGGTAVSATGSVNAASGRQLIVGAYWTTLRYTNGYIDDVRIIKGKGVYTENFTPPSQDFSEPT